MFLTSLPVESIQASFGYLVTREHVKDLHKLMIVAEKPEAANEWMEKTLQIEIETFVVRPEQDHDKKLRENRADVIKINKRLAHARRLLIAQTASTRKV